MSRWHDLEKNHVTVSDRVSIAEYGRRLEAERELLLRVAEAADAMVAACNQRGLEVEYCVEGGLFGQPTTNLIKIILLDALHWRLENWRKITERKPDRMSEDPSAELALLRAFERGREVFRPRVVELEAERDRYRATLEWIASDGYKHAPSHWKNIAEEQSKRAREALKGTE